MRLATVKNQGVERVGVPYDGGFIDLNRAQTLALRRRGLYDAESRANDDVPNSIVGILSRGVTGIAAAREALDFASDLDHDELASEGVWFSEASATFLPVINNAAKFLCVGRNYLEHAKEAGTSKNDVPIIFARFASSLVGHMQPIVKPLVSDCLDWEVELAVVIGEPCRHVKRDAALDVVAGYSIFNDGSLRDYQKRGVQWTAGKNFWHTGPFGPFLVTRDEVPNPHILQLTTRVNGTLVQNANTADMIYDVRALIAHITEWIPLEPGDVIATGTCAGIGMVREPPWYLKQGDTVTMAIDKLGTLENPVVNEDKLVQAS